MLPTPIYEALPYAYLALAFTAVPLSDFAPPALLCAGLLVWCAHRILQMRHLYRHTPGNRHGQNPGGTPHWS